MQDNKRLCKEIRRTYRLRRFANSLDPDYTVALGIYRQSITPGARTNTNEITFWLDEYPKRFEDEFCILGFYSNSEVIGFVQFVYFKKHRLIFFDYLVLHEPHRSHGEYFQLARMVRDWIEEQGFEFDYVVAEVAFETSSNEPSSKGKSLAQLFQQIGFSVAHCEYFQPPLGIDNPQSDMRAFLLIWAHGRPDRIKRETLMGIISAVYFDHYERWYEPFIPTLPEYHRTLKKRFELLDSSVPARSDVILNGIQLADPPLPSPPAPRPASPAKFNRIVATVGVVWCLFLGLASVVRAFNLTHRALFELALVSLLIFVSIFSLYNSRGERILKLLLKSWKSLFHTGK